MYVRFASNVTSAGDVSDVMSVNTVLQQCTGKVVRLNIQFETIVEFNTTMLLAVLMELCNFVSAGIETSNGTFHLQLVKGFRAYLSFVVKWLGS